MKTQPIEDNPVGIARETAEALVPELDRHQASLFTLFHQVQKHHWLVEGPQFMDLHKVLQAHYEEIHAGVDRIAERITALGGVPTAAPAELARRSYLAHEAEGKTPVRAMLTLDREHEGRVARELRSTIRQARELGDYGTEHLLCDVLLEVEDRAHHLDHFLADD